MKRHAKAPSAGSIEGAGNDRGLFRRAFATRAASISAKGSGAPASRRARSTLALAITAFALLTSLALAAPALAADPTAEMVSITNPSYTSATVKGKVNFPEPGFNSYAFEYATSESGPWTSGPVKFVGVGPLDVEEEHFAVPKGGTKYFVRVGIYFGSITTPALSFTTLTVEQPSIPGAVEASPVFSTSVTATAKVKRPANADPAFDVNCHFEYVTDDQFEENVNVNSQPGFTGATSAPCEQNPVKKVDVDLQDEKEVTAPLTGLSPSTDYHLRLVAENAAPGAVTKDAANFTTLPTVTDKPTVIATEDATGVTIHEATVKGEVQRPAGADPALNIECRFEYVTQSEWEANSNAFPDGAPSSPCAENPITAASANGEGKQKVSSQLGGLKPATVYHLRLTAENGGGTDSKDPANTFTTLPADLPTVTIDPVEGGTFTTAHVSGTVEVDDPGYEYARVIFEVSTDSVNWSEFEVGGVCTCSPPGTDDGIRQHDYTGLQPVTTYFFRIATTYSGSSDAEANGEVAFSPIKTITTEPLFAPTTENLAVTDVTGTSAHFSATVDPHAPAGPLSELGKKAFATKWHFECTPKCLDVNENVISGTVQGEEGAQTVAGDAKRLEPNTKYEVSLIVSSEGGGETVVETFNTSKSPPSVKQETGASDGTGGYVLQGVVNPHNETVTDCKFEWGPDANQFAFSAPCSPLPRGRDEVQRVEVYSKESGQFRLSFGGQTTGDMAFAAQPSVVQAELEALSSIGPSGISQVTRTVVRGNSDFPIQRYDITFSGPLAGTNLPPLQGESGTEPLNGIVVVSTFTDGGTNVPITVEAHLTGLTPGVIYHSLLVVTYGAGLKADSGESQEFKPTLSAKEACPANEQLRTENSSLALPECRAYEMVTPPGKEGFNALFVTYDGGARFAYESRAGNIAKSGQAAAAKLNKYVAARTESGWETIPNLNGSSGSLRDAPSNVDSAFNVLFRAYSSDLLSSIWSLHRQGESDSSAAAEGLPLQLRSPDGTFARVQSGGGVNTAVVASADLSHVVTPWNGSGTGPGVYEYIGTGMAQPRRVDVDNSGAPISACTTVLGRVQIRSVSSDGSRIFLRAFGGCGAANLPAGEIWARVNGTTSFDVSASHCNRTAADPGGVCNGPTEPGGCVEDFSANTGDIEGIGCRTAKFAAATPDGSRVFFTTTQQLVNADTDQTNDIYACDIPSGDLSPSAEKANHCAAFMQVSSAQTGADVESVNATSENGSTVLFVAKGVLADNKDALGEKAVAGDHNLYVWRTDASHPDGQTAFVGRLDSVKEPNGDLELTAQTTPDGRYLVFSTASTLLDTDTDSYRDVYRYDADTGDLTRVSTNISGVAGNGEGFDATIAAPTEHHPSTTISDNGTKIVFVTTEALSPADGNAEPDVYLWTPARVSLISTGSSGFAPREEVGQGNIRNPRVAIDPSGEDVYFESAQPLTPADSDRLADVYDARIGGGFSFAQKPICTGEKCQPDATLAAPQKAPLSAQPGAGNPPQPKPCLKGKVRKKNGKCAKKPKKHSGKKHHGKKASHKQGGGK